MLLFNLLFYVLTYALTAISLKCEQNQAILQIQDSGIGILPADQTRLFEPFNRGKNVRNLPGTGLGLVVVKKCVDLQGGNITINSLVGVGTTVTVTLPLRQTED